MTKLPWNEHRAFSPPGGRKLAARIAPHERPVVFIGPYEHHTNELMWREAFAEVVVVGLSADGGLDLAFSIEKRAGESLGVDVSSAVFDRVRTCDNHCEFCFIYQLPKGMRRSLYLKDDDYRLSFLYGNFTTLTRFTEADLERVITERLSPLHVSIHATDPDVRSHMLKNPRAAMCLRWLRALLDHDIVVRGQIVVCPGVNDGAVLADTMAGILDRFPDLDSVAVVPLGISKFNGEAAMRLRGMFNLLFDVDKHYQRKEYLLFPFLEKLGAAADVTRLSERSGEATG